MWVLVWHDCFQGSLSKGRSVSRSASIARHVMRTSTVKGFLSTPIDNNG
jgi:hypothetical protein